MEKSLINKLETEQINAATVHIDQCSTEDMLTLINNEDQTVPLAIAPKIPAIASAVDGIVGRLRRGGRLIYVGAGTSGRIGVLDASECPPTYSTPPELVVPLIAGGESAIFHACEGAEDDEERGQRDMAANKVDERDAVVGISASGRTPYVVAAMREAARRGALTVGLYNTNHSPLQAVCEIPISVVVGPEVITGSTRMKAGTAQKLVLNMLSTCAMIKMGKVYQNLMVDLNASNKKLSCRAENMLLNVTEADRSTAEKTLAGAGGDVKKAALMIKFGIDIARATEILERSGGVLRAAIESCKEAEV